MKIDFNKKQIDAIFRDLDQCHLPGATVGISLDGRPIYRRGFGLASVEQSTVLSPTTRMRIASITKHITSLAFMLLCEDGWADVDDPIGKYMPELHPTALPVTMRQLMANVSGLRDADDITYQFSGSAHSVTAAEIASTYRDLDDLNAAPGALWSYNNGGYIILTIAIERITRQPFGQFLHDRVFTPLGMHDTLLRPWDTDFLPNSATAHMIGSNGQFQKVHRSIEGAGQGGIVSTVDDMLRWLSHMNSPVIGTSETWSLIKTPHVLANGEPTGYGLGLSIGEYRGAMLLSHSGGALGANAQLLQVPAAALGIIVMVNRHDVSASSLAFGVLDACLPGLNENIDKPETTYPTGVYRSPTTGRVVELHSTGDQPVVSIDGVDLPAEFIDHGELRPARSFRHYAIRLKVDSAQPRSNSISLIHFGERDELLRVSPELQDTREIAGRYRSAATGTTITISTLPKGIELTSAGRFGSITYSLDCIANDVWRARSISSMPWGGILCFADRKGFTFSSGRIRSLPFSRVEKNTASEHIGEH